MSYVLIRLLQRFSGVHLTPEAHPPAQKIPDYWAEAEGRTKMERCVPSSHLTLYAKGGMWLTLDEARESETD